MRYINLHLTLTLLKLMTPLIQKLINPFSPKTSWLSSRIFKMAAIRQPFLSIILQLSKIWWCIWWLSLHFWGQGKWWYCSIVEQLCSDLIAKNRDINGLLYFTLLDKTFSVDGHYQIQDGIDVMLCDRVWNCTPEKRTAQTYHQDWVWYRQQM